MAGIYRHTLVFISALLKFFVLYTFIINNLCEMMNMYILENFDDGFLLNIYNDFLCL